MDSERNTISRRSVYTENIFAQFLHFQRPVQGQRMAHCATLSVRSNNICFAQFLHCLKQCDDTGGVHVVMIINKYKWLCIVHFKYYNKSVFHGSPARSWASLFLLWIN